MKYRGIWLAFLSVMTIFFALGFSACDRTESNAGNTAVNSSDAASNTLKKEPESDPVKDKDVGVNSPCSLEYYPISAEKQTQYKVTGAGAGTYTLSHSEITEKGFSEKRNFSYGLEIVNNWVCEPEGIRNAVFTNTGMGDNTSFTVDTLSSSGITLPREISVGKEFESSYDVNANVTAGGLKANGKGKVSVKSKVAAIDEPLNIGGKDYKTIRIENTTKINVTVTGRGIEAGNLRITNWYAPGVGLVKQETKSNLGNQTVTIEE